MPKVDMDQEKATIISWNKSEGDPVKENETVLVVETEKVAIDVPSPITGTLVGIKYKVGDVVPVATVIAYVLKSGETLADLPTETAKSEPTKKLSDASPIPHAETSIAASPLAARMAKDLGIDINLVPSSGTRISKEDIEAYASAQKENFSSNNVAFDKIAATPAARRISAETGVPLESIKGSGPFGRVQASDVKSSFVTSSELNGDNPAEIIPLVGMRQKIAQRLQASFQEAPHIAETIEVDVSRLDVIKKHLNESTEVDQTSKVSMTAILVKLIAWALERNPYINSSLQDQSIYLWKNVNVGIATSIDSGLIVPVVHNANLLSMTQIAMRINDVSLRARQGRLELKDVQKGTFTVTNLGMYNIHQFRAVINPPECAILAIGAIRRKPVVVDKNDTIAVRPIISLTLSADHRVIDGVVAARFLNDLEKVIEYPEILIN
jgi:pyruvate dehydrogenase E2 component (dihydrolipoamide acetyltransferase)